MDGVLDLRGRGLRQGQREDRRRRDPQDAQAKCRGSQRGPPPGRQGGGVRPHGAHRRRRGGGRGQDGTDEGTVEIHRGRDRGVLEAAACRDCGGRRGPQVALQAPSGRALSLESAPSPVSPETLLALALVAVYVADSAHFLAIGAALIGVVAPFALALGDERLFVAATLLCLALSAAACALTAWRRKELRLTGLPLFSTILVALVCLPCAGNLARSVAAQRRWSVGAAELPALGFEGIPAATLRAQLQEALGAARRALPEDSAAHSALSEQLRRLEGEAREPD